MAKNTDRYQTLPRAPSPWEFSVGSDESRAAARAALDNIGGPPDMEICFFDGLGDQANAPGFDFTNWKASEGDSRRASFLGYHEHEWLRNEGETLAEFKKRVWNEVPVGGVSIIFWSLEGDPKNAQPQV
jgi:hypothetical protein